jgi:hypothetical protein
MTLSRRGFLVLGGAAAAVTLVGNQQVLAAVTPSDRYDVAVREAQALFDTMSPNRKAIAALRTYDRRSRRGLIEPNQVERASLEAKVKLHDDTDPWYESSDYTAWLKRSDAWLKRTMADFQEPPPDHEIVGDLFDNRLRVDALDTESLREIVPGLAPIALVRQMVCENAAAFHMTRMDQFNVFAERYRAAIMA